MNTTIGTSQTVVTVAATSVQNVSVTTTYYMTRFVSPLLNQSSILSGTWTYAFGANQDWDANNFPVGSFFPSSMVKAVRVNCYIWKPSNGTKVGTILDGNTAITVKEGAHSTITLHKVDFTGSAVSGITPSDAVMIFEVWFVVNTTADPTGSNYFYFDGTDNVITDNAVSGTNSVASYLETPQTLVFIQNAFVQKAVPTQTVAVSESITKTVIRQLRQRFLSDTTPITDSIYSHASPQPRHIQLSLPTEIVSINDGGNVGHVLTRSIPLNKQCSPYTEDTKISDFTECKTTSGTVIYTGDPEYMMT